MSIQPPEKIQFIDLKAQHARIASQVDNGIRRVLEHGQYILGPEIRELESALAKYVGTKHCVAVASGTDGLVMSLMALGIGYGDEVIVPAFSFFATAEVVCLVGAKPVFVDIEPRTYNLDWRLLEGALSKSTKAIIPVGLYGQCAEMDEINSFAKKHGLFVIEDGAQSFGATYRGRRSCGLSDIGVTSFFPAKPLGCYGDGGAIFTNSDEWAKALQEIRVHGQSQRYYHTRLGVTGRIDTIQAAILLTKLEIFDDEMKRRQAVAKRYDEALRGVVSTPLVSEHNVSAYAQYTIEIENRDYFQKELEKLGVPTAVHYPFPMYRQPALKAYSVDGKGNPLKLPFSETAAERVVSLPFHPYMSDETIDYIAKAIRKVLV